MASQCSIEYKEKLSHIYMLLCSAMIQGIKELKISFGG